jgi:hypothetical protein
MTLATNYGHELNRQQAWASGALSLEIAKCVCLSASHQNILFAKYINLNVVDGQPVSYHKKISPTVIPRGLDFFACRCLSLLGKNFEQKNHSL